jgi:hypothetical protein
MFKKIALILFTFTILIASITYIAANAIDAELEQNDSESTSLWAGKATSFPSDEGLTSEPIDEEQDSVDAGSKPQSICDRPDSCLITGLTNSQKEELEENGYKPQSLCNGNCPITDGPGNIDSNYSKSTTLTLATSILRFVVFVITGLSFLAILGGLIAAVFLSVKRKKFAITPFLVVVGGILFLVISIICITIINLASFF